MNEPNEPNPVPGPNSYAASPKPARSGNPLVWIIVSLVMSGMLAVAAYSIYVSVHEPDRQETVVLGQTKVPARGMGITSPGTAPKARPCFSRSRVWGRNCESLTY